MQNQNDLLELKDWSKVLNLLNKLFKNEFIIEKDVNLNETDLLIVNFII